MAIRCLARNARRALDAGAYAAWRGLFRTLGRLGTACEPAPPGDGRRVLVVAPHPDDEALGCGGTLMQHVAAGDFVCVAIVTDGRLSRAHGLAPEAMARARCAEAAAAAELLGVDALRRLALEEGGWRQAQLEPLLAELIVELRPDLIYAPSTIDYAPEHRRVAAALARVVPAATRVRVCTLHVPLSRLANVRVDVSAQLPRIERLFETYSTQKASLQRGLRLRRYAAAWSRRGTAAEEFWELSGEAYRHAQPSEAAPFSVRGVRFSAFGDPLSYWIGRRARIRFARALESR